MTEEKQYDASDEDAVSQRKKAAKRREAERLDALKAIMSQAYLSVIEQALDLLTMQTQQLAELEGRTLQFPIVDQTPTTTLPAAVQRANMGLAFDANGNPIAGALPSVAVSAAMAPLFQAPSLAAALPALGGGATGIALFQAATAAVAVAALGILTAAQTFKSTTPGAAVEEFLTLLRNKGTAGSNNDFGEALAFAMMNAADTQKTFARTYAEIIGNVAGSESGALLWDTIQSGTLAPRMTLQAGLQVGAPSGGDKGAGSVNAQTLWLNGTQIAGVPVFTKSFVSTQQTITSNSTLTIPHGLGVVPLIVTGELICQTAEFGYNIGDVIQYAVALSDASVGNGIGVKKDATNITVHFSTVSTVFEYINFSTGGSNNLTNANWKLVLRAFA